jgi:protein-tyrosine-phosphatase
VAKILFVCTGNLCRSPSAAWFFRKKLSELGPKGVTVEDSGTTGSLGSPPERLLKEGEVYGLDLKGHVSTKINPKAIKQADLIICMAREHVREVVLADNPAFVKTFTFREIVRRGKEKGARLADETLKEWLLRLNGGRRHIDLIGDSPLDDTPDPMGGFSDDFRRMLEEMDSLTTSLHELMWPQV